MLNIRITARQVPTSPWSSATVHSVDAIVRRPNVCETEHCGTYGSDRDARERGRVVRRRFEMLGDARSIMPAARPGWKDA